ncbi:MAG: helicase RepA family protein [Anaerolineales bacterium]|nr:helicase RepA family protein [Anaerolineales bacterium]
MGKIDPLSAQALADLIANIPTQVDIDSLPALWRDAYDLLNGAAGNKTTLLKAHVGPEAFNEIGAAIFACKPGAAPPQPTAPGAAAMPNMLVGLSAVCDTELYSRDYPPRKPLIEGLIYRGNCAILAGRPKSGKSWLLFQMAEAIGAGRPFLGRQTTKAKVLYLALEDGERRIHERMHVRKWQAMGNVSFVFGCLPFDGDGAGLAQVGAAATDFDVIIIDTLIAVLSAETKENDNTAMGAILNGIARYAHESDKAVVLSHHTGKGDSEDPFDAIRGASSIRGAYDLGIVIQRKTKEREAVLRIESRDIEADDMTIIFDGATGWSYEGDASAYEGITAGRKVVKALAELGDGKTAEEIAEHMGVTRQAAQQQLQKAEGRSLVRRESVREGKAKAKDLWYRD